MVCMSAEVITQVISAAAAAFADTPVRFAYLFGSHASGRTHAESDIDVAVYLADDVSTDDYLDYRLSLAGRIETEAGVSGVEVVVLNEAPLPLKGRIVKNRVVLYSCDEAARVRFERLTLNEFFDFEIYAQPLAQTILRDIAEGRR